MTLFLKSAQIINYKSLADVTLNFRDLTILIGANSSGKSNCLEVFSFLKFVIFEDANLSIEYVNSFKRKKNKADMEFVLNLEDSSQSYPILSKYKISLGNNEQNYIFSRELLTIENNHHSVDVIDIEFGKGKVQDEDGSHIQDFKSISDNLALKTAGNFGKKPITSQIADFIRKWQIYNLDPYSMRKRYSNFNRDRYIPLLDSMGSFLEQVLIYWFENDQEKFLNINQDLNKCLGISLKAKNENGEPMLIVLEQGELEISLFNMSDGTLRLIAYYVLLYEDNPPSLIGIEEPERNLHPKLFPSLARVLKKLSMKTQLIITTHSYYLLDCFTLEEIQDDVMVLCLSKKDKKGTQVFELDKLGEKREDLTDWMLDFGVGSAVYNSNLLEECLEEQYA